MVEVTHATGPRRLPAMTWEERRDLALFRLMCALPVAAVSRLGAGLGQVLGRRAHPAAAARVAAALHLLRPDLAADENLLEAAQRRLWANVGRIYAEFCVLDKIVAGGRVGIADSASLDAVLGDGRPVIIAYTHLGNWEATGMLLAQRAPGRVCAMANALPTNRVQAQVAARQRERWPGTVFTVDDRVWRHVLVHLQQPGKVLYIAVDEHVGAGVRVPSFGRALDHHGNLGKIVRIAARTGAIILPAYSERLPGAQFREHFLEPLYFTRGQDMSAAATLQHIARLDALFEPVVRRLVDQWFGLLEYRP